MPLEHAVDGFLVHGRVGTTCPPLAAGVASPDPLIFRTDRAAPVLVLESEFDTLRSWQARQPDTAALPAVGARGLDAPGRVRRAHVERPVRARSRQRAAGLRLRGERHAVPLRGARGVVAPARLGAPRRAAARAAADLDERRRRHRPRSPRQRTRRHPAPPPRGAGRAVRTGGHTHSLRVARLRQAVLRRAAGRAVPEPRQLPGAVRRRHPRRGRSRASCWSRTPKRHGRSPSARTRDRILS